MHGTRLSNLSVLFCLFVSCFGSEALAKGRTYQLQYKFKMGEVIRYAVKHTSNIRSTMEGSTQEAESWSESIKAWKVTDVLPDGQMEFIHVVEQMKMTNRVPNRDELVYDSESGEKPPVGFEQAARAVGVPLSLLRIDATGKVVHREEKHPQPETHADIPLTLTLPKKKIKVGEKWDTTYEVPLERKSGGKTMARTRRVCTLKKVSNGIAVIDVDYQILTPLNPHLQSQVVDRMTDGTVRFDIKRGRIVSQQFSADKRVIGFAGETSSMHYVSRLEERLLKPGQRVAKKSNKKSK